MTPTLLKIKEKLQCLVGYHKHCKKLYKIDEPNQHICCENSGKYIETIHQEQDDCNKVVAFFDPNKGEKKKKLTDSEKKEIWKEIGEGKWNIKLGKDKPGGVGII